MYHLKIMGLGMQLSNRVFTWHMEGPWFSSSGLEKKVTKKIQVFL